METKPDDPTHGWTAQRVVSAGCRTAWLGSPAGVAGPSAVSWSLPGGWPAPQTAAPGRRTPALPGPTGDGPHRPSTEWLAGWRRFDRLAFVGRGGMGCVYRARDRRTGRRVAVKLLVAGCDPSDTLREARLQSRAAHPSVLPVLDRGRVAGLPWFSMPYVAGSSLTAAARRLGLGRSIRLVHDVGRALASAHRRGIVHCDVNPRNILVARAGSGERAWLIDFGIARQEGRTRAGRTFGTPASMAPEQVDGGGTIDPRTDVYGLGATLYELATGRPPFSASTRAVTTGTDHPLEEGPPPFAGRAADAPAGLEEIVRRCLARAPSDRYPSTDAVADQLARLAAG